MQQAIIQWFLCNVRKFQKKQKELKKGVDISVQSAIIVSVKGIHQTEQVPLSSKPSTLTTKHCARHRQAKADKVGAIYSGLTGANWWLRYIATAQS